MRSPVGSLSIASLAALSAAVHGDVAQLLKHRTGTPLTQVRFPGAARDFFSQRQLSVRLSYGVRTPPCAIACINICAPVKDYVVHVGVRWIVKTLKHPACTVGQVARLCCSWLSQGKATRISDGKNPNGAIQKYENDQSDSQFKGTISEGTKLEKPEKNRLLQTRNYGRKLSESYS